jgi:uncharacterized protein YgbK (DUF1537 family)
MAYYGDDFTGSADAMEALTLNGVPTLLFVGRPDPSRLQGLGDNIRAVGIAGTSRAMAPAEMDGELPPQFRLLQELGAPLIHYKVCATFDSSPQIGSIGHAADLAFATLKPAFGVIVQGVPIIGRYVVFGNHFTQVGDSVYRLDRHPMMSRHPITPMNESDLRLHLARQTAKKVALLDLLCLEGPFEAARERFDRFLTEGQEIILFDTLQDRHLLTIGRLLQEKMGSRTILAIGSSGLEYALAFHWRESGLVSAPLAIPPAGRVPQLLVMSGSAADRTAEQIEFALEHGFVGIRIPAEQLVDPNQAPQARKHLVDTALGHLRKGKSLILYSALGSGDAAIGATKAKLLSLGIPAERVGQHLGREQGLILRELLEKTSLKRIAVAGGDTCSYALRQLNIECLELLMPITPAAPLCRAFSPHPRFDRLEVASKGGQIGKPEYFLQVLNG